MGVLVSRSSQFQAAAIRPLGFKERHVWRRQSEIYPQQRGDFMTTSANLPEPLQLAQILDRAGRLLPQVFMGVSVLILVEAGLLALWKACEAELLPAHLANVFLLMHFIPGILLYYAGILISSRYWLGGQATFADIRHQLGAQLRIGRVIDLCLMTLFIGFITLLFMVPLIIPGLIYATNRCLAVNIFLVENCTSSEAIKKSKYLMTREKWYSLSGAYVRFSGLCLVVIVIYFITAEGTTLLGEIDLGTQIGNKLILVAIVFIQKVFTAVTQLYSALAYIGFYYDLRSRYEGADILAELNEL